MTPAHEASHAPQSGSAPEWATHPAPRSASSSGSGRMSVESTAPKIASPAVMGRAHYPRTGARTTAAPPGQRAPAGALLAPKLGADHRGAAGTARASGRAANPEAV